MYFIDIVFASYKCILLFLLELFKYWISINVTVILNVIEANNVF